MKNIIIRPLMVFTIVICMAASVEARLISLDWEAEPNSVKYKLEIAVDRLFEQIIKELEVEGTSHQVDLGEGNYYFRVAGINQGGIAGQYSEVKFIRVEGETAEDAEGNALLMANYFYYLGLNYYHHQDPQTAEAYFEEALRLDPSFQLMTKDVDDEINIVTMSSAQYTVCKVEDFAVAPLFPWFFHTYEENAEDYYVIGNMDKAIELLEYIKKADPFNEEVNQRLAELYEIRGEEEYPVGLNDPLSPDRLREHLLASLN